jgi:hypothetical protein
MMRPQKTSRLRVMTDVRDIERTKRGSIIGRIWFAAGADAFPAAGWSDFVVVVLGWWIGQLLDLRKGRRDHLEFRFMDGPFSILIEPAEGDEVLAISFHTDRESTPRIPASIQARRSSLEAELVTTARTVVAACRRKEWHDNVEVKKLVGLADELSETLGANEISRRPPPPSREEVENRLLDLIGGDISREEASNWARRWVVADGAEIESHIWQALIQLLAADMISTDRPYLYGKSDFQRWLTELRQQAK